MYPAEIVKPMKDELINIGFDELLSPDAVDNGLSKPGTTLIVVNSVCGCAAANARPAVKGCPLKMKKLQIIYRPFLQE